MSADTVDKVLGVAGGVSWVISYIFYRLFRNRIETARQVRNIPIYEPSKELHSHLSDNGPLAYAAVEGVVNELNRALISRHGNNEGVIRESQLIEHKSQRINGFWSNVKKVLKDTTEYVPFSISPSRGDDHGYKVEVLDPGQAARLRAELDITHEKFEPHKSSFMQIGIDRLFGEVSKGLEESEKMLLSGTSIIGVGKVFLERGQMKIAPPDEENRTYILTKMRLSELVRHYEKQSSMYKIIAVVTALIGGGLISVIIWRQTKVFWERRKQRLQFEEIRRTLADAAERRRAGNTETGGAGENSEPETDNACVVCLSNPRQVVALSCGHIALCTNCAEALPLPKMCPVCRANVERFLPVFHP
ncbi:mitochondrial ubiquitin ligase activator of nfkb 1 [Plakobranchus ocellatus]|uniref:RING-type E3 ubiquitin transferase n=1 Tax=Plakobranchus ocellatus TaxID=259542 RepID=A0AAV3Y2R0_9GAST|nr:mitochondrial ubiquitin ligase activator of nfkb 1 [Plakobranchus ocellatus]